MRLLLTRAQEDAERTGEKLAAAGHTIEISPVFDVVPTRAGWPDGVFDAVVATSAHAFTALAGRAEPSPEVRRLVPLFVVGKRTAEAAEAAKFAGLVTTGPDSAGLAAMIEVLEERPKRMLYLTGRDRKPDLEELMRSIGQSLEIVEIYAARRTEALVPAVLEALRHQTIDGVLHYSRRSARIFIDLAEAAGVGYRGLKHFCLSDDVTVPLRNAGCEAIEVAASPNEAALLDCVPQASQA